MLWCEACLRHVDDRGAKYWICSCNGRAALLEEQAVGERRDYERWLGNALRAPLSGSGLKLMLVGSLCYGLLDAWIGAKTRATLSLLAINLFGVERRAWMPDPADSDLLYGATGIALFLIVLGYQFAWFLQVIQDSARGRPALDQFPDFTSTWESVGAPALMGFATIAATVGPGAIAMLAGPIPWWIGGALALGGFVVLPMALASIALDGSLRGLDPVRILAGIKACSVEYGFAAGLFTTMVGAIFGGSLLFGAVPVVGALLKAFVILSTSAMSAQVLGLVIARKESTLRWLAGLRHRA